MDDLEKLRKQGQVLICGLAWLSLALVLAGSLVATSGVMPVVLAAALTVYPTLVALRAQSDGGTRIALGATMPLYCAILLYQWSGHPWQIDLHMTFFAMIAVLAALADWRPVLAGAAVTALHHLGLNFIAPALVFGATGDLGRVVLHAGVVVLETGILIVLANRLEALLRAQAAARAENERLEQAARLEREQREREQQLVVSEIEKGLNALASGDLTCPITVPFPSGFEALRTDFNRSIDQLDHLIASVVQASGQIQVGTSEIRTAAEDLAHRTEMEAASVERATHSIGTLVHSADAMATQAADANRTLSVSQERAASGQAVVTDAMQTMKRIEESAAEISQIITLIDGIAFQTNLLALNAGVEAARAGEAGKGFAVVANEVRALAQRSPEAASSIKDLINSSSSRVEEGVDLVSRTGRALNEVMGDVSTICGLVDKMAGSARHNADVLARLREVLVGIDRSTQQNAAMVEESHAALRTLGQETTRLIEVVAHFKPREESLSWRHAA